MSGPAITKRLLCAAVFATVALAAPVQAAEPVYQALFKTQPAPALAAVQGREYKFLIDPAAVDPKMEQAFEAIWRQVVAAAQQRGFDIQEKDKDAFKIDLSTKEYLDTPEQALWKAGYLIRISTNYKAGNPESDVRVTIKAVNRGNAAVLAHPLSVVGVAKFKLEAEDAIGFQRGGQLGQYIEKGASFTVPAAALASRTLGDFARYVPELAKLGLPASTKLNGITAYSYRVKPGVVVLPDVGACGVSMEAWSRTLGGQPYLYDFSFGYGDVDFYAVAEAHAVGERFMDTVFGDQLYRLQPADGEKWGGSKVRYLMNRPL